LLRWGKRSGGGSEEEGDCRRRPRANSPQGRKFTGSGVKGGKCSTTGRPKEGMAGGWNKKTRRFGVGDNHVGKHNHCPRKRRHKALGTSGMERARDTSDGTKEGTKGGGLGAGRKKKKGEKGNPVPPGGLDQLCRRLLRDTTK